LVVGVVENDSIIDVVKSGVVELAGVVEAAAVVVIKPAGIVDVAVEVETADIVDASEVVECRPTTVVSSVEVEGVPGKQYWAVVVGSTPVDVDTSLVLLTDGSVIVIISPVTSTSSSVPLYLAFSSAISSSSVLFPALMILVVFETDTGLPPTARP